MPSENEWANNNFAADNSSRGVSKTKDEIIKELRSALSFYAEPSNWVSQDDITLERRLLIPDYEKPGNGWDAAQACLAQYEP